MTICKKIRQTLKILVRILCASVHSCEYCGELCRCQLTTVCRVSYNYPLLHGYFTGLSVRHAIYVLLGKHHPIYDQLDLSDRIITDILLLGIRFLCKLRTLRLHVLTFNKQVSDVALFFMYLKWSLIVYEIHLLLCILNCVCIDVYRLTYNFPFISHLTNKRYE